MFRTSRKLHLFGDLNLCEANQRLGTFPSRVNVNHFDSLVGMDFPPGAAAEALRQADNSINLAIEVKVLS